ncbi:hypothetical protein ANN_12998 [Periplaneta americana]|uniref:Reverse transcriptase domain-containing protein n=1 Tax=Periplaneta americana TaxID=6978 RepID=A0ABQ8TJ62_PERAM|nr:hypothetical protein ANN_12998 [Periplaneta americana]
MSPGSSTESYPAFAHIGLTENPGKNLNQDQGVYWKCKNYKDKTERKRRTTRTKEKRGERRIRERQGERQRQGEQGKDKENKTETRRTRQRQGEQDKDKENKAKTRRTRQRQGEQDRDKENKTETRRTRQRQGEQDRDKENKTKTRRTRQRQGEQDKDKENKTKTRRTRQRQGEQDKDKKNKTKTRRTRQRQGEQDKDKETRQEDKTRDTGASTDKTRRTRQRQGENKTKDKKNKTKTRRTRQRQGEQDKDKKNKTKTRRTRQRQGERDKDKENKTKTKRTRQRQGERDKDKENKTKTRRTRQGQGEQGKDKKKATTERTRERQLQEKILLKNGELHMTFIDLEKAYDSVPRQLLWTAMRNMNIHDKWINIVRKMYSNTKAKIKIQNKLTEEIRLNKGLKQGCRLSPVLFNIYIDQALNLWYKKCSEMGIPIEDKTLHSLLFADDQVIFAGDEDDIIYMSKINNYEDKHQVLCFAHGDMNQRMADEDAVQLKVKLELNNDRQSRTNSARKAENPHDNIDYIASLM